jgi:hypothetical protein
VKGNYGVHNLTEKVKIPTSAKVLPIHTSNYLNQNPVEKRDDPLSDTSSNRSGHFGGG